MGKMKWPAEWEKLEPNVDAIIRNLENTSYADPTGTMNYNEHERNREMYEAFNYNPKPKFD